MKSNRIIAMMLVIIWLVNLFPVMLSLQTKLLLRKPMI